MGYIWIYWGYNQVGYQIHLQSNLHPSFLGKNLPFIENFLEFPLEKQATK